VIVAVRRTDEVSGLILTASSLAMGRR